MLLCLLAADNSGPQHALSLHAGSSFRTECKKEKLRQRDWRQQQKKTDGLFVGDGSSSATTSFPSRPLDPPFVDPDLDSSLLLFGCCRRRLSSLKDIEREKERDSLPRKSRRSRILGSRPAEHQRQWRRRRRRWRRGGRRAEKKKEEKSEPTLPPSRSTPSTRASSS